MCLCCPSKTGEVTCGFLDSEFSRGVWSDPDGMISGGDVVGDLDTENTRVTTTITFPTSDSFMVSARVSVSDGSGNWAGMEIVDAGGFNANLIIDSTGSAATTVIVRGKGTAEKTANGEYILAIEYILGIPAPIINYRVNGVIVDSGVVTGTQEAMGELRLTAFTSARVLSFGITCPPIGGITGCTYSDTAVVNAVVLDGIVDLGFPDSQGGPWNILSSWPLGSVHKISPSFSETGCRWGVWLAQRTGGTVTQGVFLSLYLTTATSFPLPALPLPEGLKAVVALRYDVQSYPVFDATFRWNQTAVYWDVLTATPETFDPSTLAGTSLTLRHEEGIKQLGVIDPGDITYRGNFTAGPTATLTFKP